MTFLKKCENYRMKSQIKRSIPHSPTSDFINMIYNESFVECWNLILLLFVDSLPWRIRFGFPHLFAQFREFRVVFLGEPNVEWDVESYIIDRY